MNTAIIGAGELGSWFAKQYAALGRNIILNDIDTQKGIKASQILRVDYSPNVDEVVAQSDEVVIAVSLENAETLIEKLGSLEGKIVYDIASIKRDIPEKLGAASETSYSLHPMWGKTTPGFQGQNMVMIPTRHGEQYDAFFAGQKARYSKMGANVHVMESGEAHDKYMASTLATMHFGAMVMAATVRDSGLENHRDLAGTTQRAMYAPIEAVINSDPTLYANIQMLNPHFHAVIESFKHNLEQLENIVGSQDRTAFSAFMSKAQRFFQGNTPPAQYQEVVARRFQDAVNAINGR